MEQVQEALLRIGLLCVAHGPIAAHDALAQGIGQIAVARHDPRPRRMDLVIASIAQVRGLPLFTRSAEAFEGLEGVLTVIAV
ncbi:hypothetical protein GCM10010207_12230 [Streptomyces atratus]|nr:hypothetical protein GCM10010207_12230 [Streptomyces atratus]